MDGGETMKKIRLLIPLFIGLVAVTAYPVFARSSEEPANVEEVNEANVWSFCLEYERALQRIAAPAIPPPPFRKQWRG